MEFTGITFLLYFLPICILGYYIFAFSKPIQNFWLLLMSLVLYSWGEPVFVMIMVGSVLINWLMGLLMHAAGKKVIFKKIILAITCIADAGLLVLMKYTNFIVDTVYDIIEWERLLDVPKIALPIGISVFVLQEISYIVDVYKDEAKVQKNPIYLGLYISFFPQMFMGPIVRYNSFAAQLKNRRITGELFAEGCGRFLTGILKKIFIANNLAVISDAVFDLAGVGADVISVPVLLAWLGAISFTLQLYFELSSYSDMAIGLAKIFGFNYQENFHHPFMARSVSEFMSGWNVSLNEWLDRYVYKPLGGDRVSRNDISLVGLVMVWLLGGLWYGASWNFVWWGLVIFAFVIIEKLVMADRWNGAIFGRHLYTIVVIVMVMSILRAEDMTHFAQMALNMFGLNRNGFYCDTVGMLIKEFWPVFIPAVLLLFPVEEFLAEKLEEKKKLKGAFASIFMIGLFGISAFNILVNFKVFKTELPAIERPVGVSGAEGYIDDVNTVLTANPLLEKTDNIVHSYVNNILHKNENTGFEYVRDKNGYLYEGNFLNMPKVRAKEMALRVKRLEKTIEDKNTKLIVMLYPSRYNEEWTNGYYGIPYNDYNEYEDKLLQYFRYYGIEHIDFRELYLAQNADIGTVLYKTDKHWRTQSAFTGFRVLTEYLNTEYNAGLEDFYTNPDNYFWETHKDAFLGSYGKKVGINYAGMDDYTLIFPKFSTMYNYTYSESGEEVNVNGDIENTLINREYLQSDDYYNKDLWLSYMGGYHETDEIINVNNTNGLNVMFICDSNTSPLATFFSSYCSNISMINPEYAETEAVQNMIEAKEYDYIFIAMSVDSMAAVGPEFCVDEEENDG